MHQDNWWRGGAIYQIYPRSFLDTTGNGVGDLAGIESKLEYIASLGVDAIWISPFVKSPMADFGYDVSDYRDIDPLFGNLNQFKSLLARAHELELKVMMDQVWSHSSDEHAWFKESRRSRTNPKSDWYVWADAKPDGTPPNNWLSVFGGPAWTWDTGRRQYYLHNFLTKQPDLNHHNPDVQQAVLDIARFWLDMGVDGFRLDVCNFLFHHTSLADNPKRADGQEGPNPRDWQENLYSVSQPENVNFLTEIRQCVDEYGGRMLLGEIADEDGLPLLIEYTQEDRLHSGYFFDFLIGDCSATEIQATLNRWLSAGKGWPTWALGNHDFARVANRWGGENPSQHQLQLFAAFQACLKGSICIYQGEELGLTQSKLQFEDLQDPQGITMWPEPPVRDGCRTPMPWSSDAPNAGFSSGKPWLPVEPSHLNMAVDIQEKTNSSMLNYYRALLRWRKRHSCLITGSMELFELRNNVIAFERANDDENLLCIFNFSSSEQEFTIGPGNYAPLPSPLSGAKFDNSSKVILAPWGASILAGA